MKHILATALLGLSLSSATCPTSGLVGQNA
jgi:hypothetical protein